MDQGTDGSTVFDRVPPGKPNPSASPDRCYSLRWRERAEDIGRERLFANVHPTRISHKVHPENREVQNVRYCQVKWKVK